jgi:hypothetical protein
MSTTKEVVGAFFFLLYPFYSPIKSKRVTPDNVKPGQLHMIFFDISPLVDQ